MPEDVWACCKCLPEEDLTGRVRLPYVCYHHDTMKETECSVVIIVEPGNNSRERALGSLCIHLNNWNELSLGTHTYYTREREGK
jgi:hypothetical protein